jgi:hypothetical protein
MDSAQRCRDQSAECLRLMRLTQSAAESTMLKNLSSSWNKIANQTERYTYLMRKTAPPLGHTQ